MKRFNFKLQKVLDIREKLELQQKNKLAIVASKYQELLQKKQKIIENTSVSRKQTYSNIAETSIHELQSIDLMEKNMNVLTQNLDKQIEIARLRVEEETKLYKKMKRDCDSIATLRDQALKKHKHTVSTLEIKTLDEISNNRSQKHSS